MLNFRTHKLYSGDLSQNIFIIQYVAEMTCNLYSWDLSTSFSFSFQFHLSICSGRYSVTRNRGKQDLVFSVKLQLNKTHKQFTKFQIFSTLLSVRFSCGSSSSFDRGKTISTPIFSPGLELDNYRELFLPLIQPGQLGKMSHKHNFFQSIIQIVTLFD